MRILVVTANLLTFAELVASPLQAGIHYSRGAPHLIAALGDDVRVFGGEDRAL